MANQLVIIHKGELLTTSRKVAEVFGRQHKNVLQSIKEICSAEKLAQSYYFETTYKDSSGKSNKEYLMNFDGFSILVMGFNGKKAIQFRVKFVEEFRRMREELNTIKLNKQNAEWLETRKDVKVLFRKSMIETIVKGLVVKGTEYHQIYKDTKQLIESYSALAYFNGTHAALRSA